MRLPLNNQGRKGRSWARKAPSLVLHKRRRHKNAKAMALASSLLPDHGAPGEASTDQRSILSHLTSNESLLTL